MLGGGAICGTPRCALRLPDGTSVHPAAEEQRDFLNELCMGGRVGVREGSPGGGPITLPAPRPVGTTTHLWASTGPSGLQSTKKDVGFQNLSNQDFTVPLQGDATELCAFPGPAFATLLR